jgi:hypothetical protein
MEEERAKERRGAPANFKDEREGAIVEAIGNILTISLNSLSHTLCLWKFLYVALCPER